MTNNIYLLLGSNLGKRAEIIMKACRMIEEAAGKITGRSSFYETAAWGKTNQPNFINRVIAIESDHNPQELLEILLNIEVKLGRVRQQKWGERIIDIDILYYDDLIVESSAIIIPHPEIQNRRFTLVPLVEISADFVHPVFKRSNSELLSTSPDKLRVTKFNLEQLPPNEVENHWSLQ